MKVALFVPCYIDQLYPQVAKAALELLEHLGCTVAYPLDQTCCGQPMGNSGCEADAVACMGRFVDIFHRFEAIVAPSASCVHYVRHHYDHLPQTPRVVHVRRHTYELCEFLTDVLEVRDLGAVFPHRVGLHLSCHGLRGLGLARPSEHMLPDHSKIETLLRQVQGLELIQLNRPDECCGFGGTFAVTEAAISARMGEDRLADHYRNGAEIITAVDMSCLMHLEGILRRQAMDIRVAHVAEILNSRKP